jgi:hypothetical protein
MGVKANSCINQLVKCLYDGSINRDLTSETLVRLGGKGEVKSLLIEPSYKHFTN